MGTIVLDQRGLKGTDVFIKIKKPKMSKGCNCTRPEGVARPQMSSMSKMVLKWSY